MREVLVAIGIWLSFNALLALWFFGRNVFLDFRLWLRRRRSPQGRNVMDYLNRGRL